MRLTISCSKVGLLRGIEESHATNAVGIGYKIKALEEVPVLHT